MELVPSMDQKTLWPPGAQRFPESRISLAAQVDGTTSLETNANKTNQSVPSLIRCSSLGKNMSDSQVYVSVFILFHGNMLINPNLK
jgi:hypothetical protein